MSSSLQPYPVFKSGAVLKHSDLNAIVTYLESQIQASRRHLDGFGILDGLEVSCTTVSGTTTLEISPGVAVLPDGQLVELTSKRSFKFSTPVNPDSKEGKALGVCFGRDLVELTNDTASTHTPLSADETRCILVYAQKEETVSAEAVSSCVRQSDLNEFRTPELRFFLGRRKPHVYEQGKACFSSPCLRLLQGEELTSSLTEALLKTISGAAREIQHAYNRVSACFPDLFCDGNFEILTVLSDMVAKNPEYVFYAYDYLKTLIGAYREFIQLPYLIGAYSRAEQDKCPQILSLGQCDKPCGCRQYWQPALTRADERAEAVFYARRMVLLSNADIKPLQQTPVHLTPSSSDQFPLSRRAIPFYINESTLSRYWNYPLHQQNLTDTIPHYGKNYCNTHLCYTEASDFIRVEGHIGMLLDKALTNVETCRKNLNLPFSVIALELNADDTVVTPLWQPHFDDLERLFQIQFSYFLAALDVYHNMNPQDDKNIVLSLLALAEKNPCYKKFNYQSFIDKVQELINTITPLTQRELAAITTFTNVFDGLKIIWRSKQARLRQLFLHRFLQCQKGFEPMCGVPRGGTLAILYKREQDIVPDLQDIEKSKEEREKAAGLAAKENADKTPATETALETDIVAEIPRLRGIVVGDLAIPCCDVDLTRTPVAVFSVSIRPETYHADGEGDIPRGGIPMEDNLYVLGMNVTIRNLALHYDGIDWEIKTKGEDGAFHDDNSWKRKGCNDMFRSFPWQGNRYDFKEVFFQVTQTVHKDGKTDTYTESVAVWVPDPKPVVLPEEETPARERQPRTPRTIRER